MSKVDLHIHSTASDGRLSPAEVVREAAMLGLTYIALADHDTVNGLSEALETARDYPGITVIPGVEINTDVPKGEAHILGYFIDYRDPELLETLSRLRDSREERAQKMIAKLVELGMPIKWERVQEIAGTGSVGRPHVAQALLEKGYIATIKEAFDKYLAAGGPAHVEREKIAPADAVHLVLHAHGLPVLAHPFTVPDPESTIVELKIHGLAGIEVYYNRYSAEAREMLGTLAKKYQLVATGGSDYHGIDMSNETPMGGAEVPLESAEQLVALAKAAAGG
ncbi:MAG: PHP domain-containing protein [Chloroflexi bacterium]|nr:PHP domain-containing protein [Chloroflexota bacterium]